MRSACLYGSSLGLCWAQVVPMLGQVGPMLSHPGPILGLCWPKLGLCWAHLGPMSGLCWAHVGLCWAYVGPCCLLGATAYVGPTLAHVEALALALSLRSSLLLLLLLALLALFALLASDFFPYALPLALAGVGGYMLRCWSTWNNRWQNVNQWQLLRLTSWLAPGVANSDFVWPRHCGVRKHSLSRRVLLHLDIRGPLRSGDFWVRGDQCRNQDSWGWNPRNRTRGAHCAHHIHVDA